MGGAANRIGEEATQWPAAPAVPQEALTPHDHLTAGTKCPNQ